MGQLALVVRAQSILPATMDKVPAAWGSRSGLAVVAPAHHPTGRPTDRLGLGRCATGHSVVRMLAYQPPSLASNTWCLSLTETRPGTRPGFWIGYLSLNQITLVNEFQPAGGGGW